MLALTKNTPFYLNKVYSSESKIREINAPERPLAEGDLAPHFTFASQNWLKNPGLVDISLGELHQKPLVIVFYSVYWNGHGINLLKKLEELQDKIGDTAGILVVTSEAPKKLYKTIGGHNFSLNFYYDENQVLAEKFGIFSEDRPTWNLFSGIETNVPLLPPMLSDPRGRSASSISMTFHLRFLKKTFWLLLMKNQKYDFINKNHRDNFNKKRGLPSVKDIDRLGEEKYKHRGKASF